MARERKNELSLAGIVLMLLVIFIHSSAECVSGYDVNSLHFVLTAAAQRTASFAVQGFLFLAGLKLAFGFGSGFSLLRYARGRLVRIGLPYLVAFAAFLAVSVLSGRYSPSFPGTVVDFITGRSASHFYFVFIMAQFCLLVPLWLLLFRKADDMLFVFVSLFLTMICMDHLPEIVRLCTNYRIELTINDRLFTSFLFFWAAGMTAGKHYEAFTSYLEKHGRSLLVLWAISAAADSALFIGIRRGTYYALWSNYFHLFTSAAAILALLSVALKLKDAPICRTPVFRAADRASYLVYLWHPMVILFLDAAMNRAGIASLSLRFVLRFLFAVLLAPALCILWQKLTSLLAVRRAEETKGGPAC